MSGNSDSPVCIDDDFQETVAVKKRKIEEPTIEDTTLKTTCPLCDLSWTNGGLHRVANLKCGHTFGISCIKDYVKKEGVCPICCAPARKRDIRSLWPDKVFKGSSSIITSLQKELDDTLLKLEEKKNTLEETKLEYQKLRLELAQLTQQSEKFKNKEIQGQHCDNVDIDFDDFIDDNDGDNDVDDDDLSIISCRYKLLNDRELSNEHNVSRVMTIHTEEQMAVISMKKDNSYGLYKCSLSDLSSYEFIGNHSALVRDVKCSKNRYDNGSILLLSTGLDKKIHLTSASNNCILQTYQLPSVGWSCEFDESNPNQFYCGLANNSIMIYDIRNTKECLAKIVNKNLNQTPVHSLISCQLNNTSTLLCSSLTQVYYYQLFLEAEYLCNIYKDQEKGYQPYAISMDKTNNETLMISNRGNGCSKHSIIQLDDGGDWLKQWEYTSPKFQSIISRTDFYSGSTCFSEDNKRIHIKGKVSSIEIPLLEQNQCIMDLKLTNNQLFCLTDNHFMIYKYG